MRHLASTTLAVFALAMCSPGVSLALPLAGGIDRAVAAAAAASAQALLVHDQPRRKRTTVVRRSTAFPFYPSAPVPSAGIVGSNGYPAYYMPNGYPYYYAGQYWPHYYGRYRWPGYDYSPFAFFGYAPSDFQ
jgi:hypothetical protein